MCTTALLSRCTVNARRCEKLSLNTNLFRCKARWLVAVRLPWRRVMMETRKAWDAIAKTSNVDHQSQGLAPSSTCSVQKACSSPCSCFHLSAAACASASCRCNSATC